MNRKQKTWKELNSFKNIKKELVDDSFAKEVPFWMWMIMSFNCVVAFIYIIQTL
jgi:hypothetical protein